MRALLLLLMTGCVLAISVQASEARPKFRLSKPSKPVLVTPQSMAAKPATATTANAQSRSSTVIIAGGGSTRSATAQATPTAATAPLMMIQDPGSAARTAETASPLAKTPVDTPAARPVPVVQTVPLIVSASIEAWDRLARASSN